MVLGVGKNFFKKVWKTLIKEEKIKFTSSKFKMLLVKYTIKKAKRQAYTEKKNVCNKYI